MSKLRVHGFSISLDGYGAGVSQSLENPLGLRGHSLHEWYFPTRSFQEMIGNAGGTTGTDQEMALRGFENIGAWILGRNMFTAERGPWLDPEWKGWWGPNPPYHVPTFVLTHHRRDSLEMEGGTTFHFVTGGIEEALERARQAAGPKDVRLGGGVQTIRQYLKARLVDHMHLAVSPVLLGSGEHLLAGLDLVALGYKVTEQARSDAALHVVVGRA